MTNPTPSIKVTNRTSYLERPEMGGTRITQEKEKGNSGSSEIVERPRFQPATGGTIKLGAFEDKGREIFRNDDYKSLRADNLYILRVQYALRLEGLNIGNHGIGGWGGDSIMGKDTRAAIRFLMKREGLNHDQAIAWAMDRAKSKLGLGSAKPYFNPKTHSFDLDKPLWIKRPKMASRADQVKWADASIYEFENERKVGPRREKLETLWSSRIEPALIKNGRSKDLIDKAKQLFFQSNAKFIRIGSVEQAQAVNLYSQKILKQEERFAWVKNQWEKEISIELKKKDVPQVVITEIKKDFFGEYSRDFIYARNAQDEAKAKESFLREKNWILSWDPKVA